LYVEFYPEDQEEGKSGHSVGTGRIDHSAQKIDDPKNIALAGPFVIRYNSLNPPIFGWRRLGTPRFPPPAEPA